MMIVLPEQVVCVCMYVLYVLLQIETDSLRHDDTVLSNFVRGQQGER
jgi:hypothetical protein